jgi:hypothetical protein
MIQLWCPLRHCDTRSDASTLSLCVIKERLQTMKKLALLMILFLILVCVVSLTGPSQFSVTINGEQINGPLKGIVGVGTLVIIPVILLCIGILLAFVFTGIGLIILGCLVFTCLVSFCVSFPFLLPVLIPLFIVWIYCALARRSKTDKTLNSKSQNDL